MKDGYYIALHTQVRFWLPLKGKYTELEALISHTLDINNNKSWSISGYSKLWGWSRTRVKNFLHNIKTAGGHHKDIHRDNVRASRGQGVVIKINNLHAKENKPRTNRRHSESKPKTLGEQYYNNNNNINNKKKEQIYIVQLLNDLTGKDFRNSSKKTQGLINSRLNEGFTVQDFETVINKKSEQWKGDPDMSKYLRPETLFGSKFEGYLNERTLNKHQGIQDGIAEMEAEHANKGL